MSLLPGTTAVDPSAALILLRTLDVGQTNTIVDVLTRNATFVSDEGETLPAVPTITVAKMPPQGITVVVTPNVALKPEHWYTFVLNEDNDVQLSNGKTPADLAARTTSVWNSDFFTGSAPHVVQVVRPLGAKDGAYVHVVFSEPVALSQIPASQFVNVDGSLIGKCLLLMSGCASSLDGAVAEEFDLAPVGPLGQFSTMTLLVPGTLKGSSRTVSQAMALSAHRFAVAAGSAGTVATTIAQNQWRPCQQGASSCWQAHNQ
ncbi:MAG TPA: hypothetical protein VK989_04960 [Polyangia bacterium]|nr:hypothetical protein [Polyangia bacterium]